MPQTHSSWESPLNCRSLGVGGAAAAQPSQSEGGRYPTVVGVVLLYRCEGYYHGRQWEEGEKLGIATGRKETLER